MSGGWQRNFSLDSAQQVTLSLRYRLAQTAHYESDEFSEVLLAVDNVLIGSNGNDFLTQIVGNGNGGPALTTEWVSVDIDVGVLAVGEHSLTIGGFNNKKTFRNEETAVLIDEVVLKATPP